ncbi:MAG: 50S ribosomal protein L22 [Bacteroidetes bacterium]|nr:50S ribosomal protein L22 [Bacteroidota bacterium]MBK8658821.1 50S ribosomal protein L22 [Bacteroidota bacterium]
MEAVAKLNNNPTSTRKMRLVADLVRGKDVYQALTILKYSKQEASNKLEKLLKSAINNWEQKNDLSAADNDLIVKEIFVDAGTMLKRFLPAPQGRAYRLRKRSNHVTIKVDSKNAKAAAPVAAEASTEEVAA